MDPVKPWIVPLVERCLSFYLGRSDDGIQMEDLGGSLSFRIYDFPEQKATVVTVRYSVCLISEQRTQVVLTGIWCLSISGARETQVIVRH
jgi:hypothetical protein